jgi:tRNA-specific 2-thiouridylase
MFNSSLKKNKRVFVGLSGGVDSSVTAKRLLDAEYDVTGVFIKTWHPDFLPCTEEQDRNDAMRVAAHLGIPFLTCDAVNAYKDEVADYMIREYTEGRTPNPDVMCNKSVKFGAFMNFARERGAEYIATGHYAEVTEHSGMFHLSRGIDINKDQSYFLWTLTQEQLSHTLFPVGNTEKPNIRREAERANLPTFAKTDSQGICFLGQVDITQFLSHYTNVAPGDVLNESGACIGSHDGALFYTIGQRQGFTIKTTGNQSVPYYVIAKDITQNTITVATKPTSVSGRTIILSQLNAIQGTFPAECEAQFRYRQTPFAVHVKINTDGHGMLTLLDKNIELPSLGQSCVLYKGNECLGGGIIHNIV